MICDVESNRQRGERREGEKERVKGGGTQDDSNRDWQTEADIQSR